jgi:hypothetical protein
MGVLTPQAVLTYIGKSATGDNTIIQDKLDRAYAYISQRVKYSPDGTGNAIFCEWCYNGEQIMVTCRAKDIVLDGITGYDTSDTAHTLTSADYLQTGSSVWKIISTSTQYTRFKVQYKSQAAINLLDDIVTEIAAFEYDGMPIRAGALNYTNKAAGEVSLSFKSRPDFYTDIDQQLDALFLRAVG